MIAEPQPSKARTERFRKFCRLATERDARIQETVRHLCEGRTDKQIARMLGVHKSTVYKYVRSIRESWQQESGDRKAAVIEAQLRGLQRVQEEALAAWQKSCTEKEGRLEITRKLTDESDPASGHQTQAKKSERQLWGDTRYLDAYLKATDMILRMVGGYAPEKRDLRAAMSVTGLVMELESEARPQVIDSEFAKRIGHETPGNGNGHDR